MCCRFHFLASLLLFAGLHTNARAQDNPALTKEQMTGAEVVSRVSFPVPGELFTALEKYGKPDWSAQFRTPIATVYTSRSQIAMNLGGLIADGYLAVEAQDGQQVKNIARDIKALSKALGVEQDLVNRANSIIEFSEKGNWDTLTEELEAVQNEVVNAMFQHNDQDLVTLVMLGGWIRGTEILSNHLSEHYKPEAARLLRQPRIVEYFVKRLAEMPKKIVDSPVMTKVRLALFDLRKALTFSTDSTPTAEEVKKVAEIAATLSNTIAAKE
jgi:hypothetical protein